MNFLEFLRNTITVIFLISILSYYVLLFLKIRKPKSKHKFSSVTIVIPAHNEEEYIERTIKSVLNAKFNGKKQVIVIDDGSIDKTYDLAKKYKSKEVIVLKQKHLGKSSSLNKALTLAKGELFAVVDADSYIQEDALQYLAIELGRDKVSAACGIVKVKNRHKFLCMWPHIELLYNSLIRSIFSKINANIVTPGALSMYRINDLREINGFSTQGFSEDMDIAIRLIRKGHKVGFSEKAISETNMPYDLKGFLRQRTRFARGLIEILKKHLQLNNTVIDIYTLPLFLFYYLQSVIIGLFTVYQLVSGYTTYFTSKGIYFSFPVLKFFFDWFSVVGFTKWAYRLFIGIEPFTAIAIVGIVSSLLSYPLFLFAIIRYDRKFDLLHLIPFVFMPVYWLALMILYTLMIPEYFKKKQYNIWKKNE